MSFNKTKLALAVAAGLAVSPAAFATNGIMQIGNGMVAHGFGGAGLANAGEAASGMDNPALIGKTGDSVSMGFSIFMPDRTTTMAGTDYDSDAKMYAIPQVAFSSKISNSVSWGIMVNAMGGMSTDYRSGPNLGINPGFALPQSVDLSGMLVAPTMSFALNKDISLGASLLIGYWNLRTRNLFGMEGGMPSEWITNEGSTMAYGVKLGGDFRVTDGISVGAVLQPKMSAGEIEFFKNAIGGFGFTGDASLTLPTTAGVGGKFAAGKNIDVVADIMYYQWSGVDVFDFFGWEDQIVYKVGAEFRLGEKTALRAGFNYGDSPIKGNNPTGTAMGAATANYPFPAVSVMHVTLGLGYKMDKNMAVNAYYLYSPENEEIDTGGLAVKMTQNAFGLGINYQSK